MKITIELNEYTEKMSEVKPLLDQELERTLEREALVINDGAPNNLVNQVVKYLEAHDCQVTVESKGKGTANRLNGLFGL
jgi:hypothetical protein